MASRVQQDTFMDDSDDTCPLCVEEFDLSDKNFRPCPCGYQICQFCYNNIKTTMNGLCPACRRRYDEKTIEWKVVSPEEAKADMALQAKKKLLARQKETERKQVETLSRKHLAGLRVMQKNLVYVVGLNPKSREEELLQTLRGDQYFGQYGKIIKIVVSKAKEGANGSNSQGIYVTFARDEDAESCINAVNGSQNGDRVLRAQFGTTKYCSAYLRNENCNNRNCMFLHDSGEEYNNVSRQDASKMNAKAFAAQGPAQSSSSPTVTAGPSHQLSQSHPHQQDAQVASAVSQPMARHPSQEHTLSRSGSIDSSALPSSASWANRNPNESRRSSKAPSVSASSPVVFNATLPSANIDASSTVSESLAQPLDLHPELNIPSSLSQRLFSDNPHPLDRALKNVLTSSFRFTFDRSIYSEEDLREIDAYPPLFDENGGLVRYRMEKERERDRLKQEEDERNTLGTLNTTEEDENPASGSLQLGGEPETQDRPNDIAGQSNIDRSAIQPPYPISTSSGTLQFSGSSIFANQPSNLTFNNRSLTPQQQQQLLLQRSSSTLQSPNTTQYQQGFTTNTTQHHHQQSNPFQSQNQSFGVPGHTRQASRYTFANDSASASAAVNPSANAQLMAQQSAMMPSNQNKLFQNQTIQQSSLHNNHFYSGVQGPPPGLKSSGTPPISGGGMFGQGHGFTTPIGGNSGLGRASGGNKNGNEDFMREFLRGRNGAINSQGLDVGKREFYLSSSSIQYPKTSNATSASGLLSSLYGSQLGAYNGYQDHGLQKQKKKGKKHRHANTSSSGGGGIVDLADPSILRMHHGGAGQGQFGTQGQGVYNSNNMVYGGGYGGSPDQDRPSNDDNTQPTEKLTDKTLNDSFELMPFGMKSGRAIAQTPISVPLGLSSTQDFPPLVAPQPPTAPKPQRKSAAANVVSPVIKPVVPVLFAQASRDSTHTKSSQGNYTSDKSNDPLNNLTSTNMEHQVAGLSAKTKAKPKPSATDFLTSQRIKILNKSTVATEPQSTKSLPTQSTLDSKSDLGLKLKISEKSVEKRQHPGKLDMAAAKEASKKEMDSTAVNSAQNKSDDLNSNAIAVSRPSTPATAVSQNSGSSATRQVQSRTIRVLPTNKAETLPRLPPASPSTTSAAPSFFNKKQPSRRGSFTSVQLPSTPVSERISDNASYTSASISRASSPPPSKIGSAPVRQVTKSQQKKERQARAKLAEEKTKTVEGPSKALVEEPVQAPILGRKKKAKKAATKNTADSTPTATRSSSPTPKDNVVQQYLEYAPATPPNEDKKETAKSLKERSEFEVPASPGNSSSHGDYQKKGTLTATAIMASFQKSTDFSATIFEMFKGINHRVELTQDDITESTTDPILSSAQIHRINDGEVIVVNKANNRPIVVLPDHSLLHGLSAEQAERYLYLREQIISTPASVAFHSNGREIDRYVHAAPHPTANGSTANKSGDIGNIYDAPTLSQTAATVSMPPYWSTAPLKNENMLRRGPPRSLEEAEQNMLEADQAWIASRKETEAIEKKLNTLIKKNRKLFLGSMQ